MITFVLLLLCVTSTLQQTCPQGQKYISNGIGNKPNGCGGSSWQVALGKAILAYD
jgi:hypothetical protein